MDVSVIGPGRWGSFIAWYLNKIGHNVHIYGRASSHAMQVLLSERQVGNMNFSEEIILTHDLSRVANSQVIVISIGSQNLRGLMEELSSLRLRKKTIVLCMKGVEIGTGQRLSEIAQANCDPSNRVAVWLGPGHVEEFSRGIPNCMVIDSKSETTKRTLVNAFSSELIRFYYGTDLIGNELGAAAKNVIGIAAGMLDGLGLSSLKGPLMSRGTREVARLIMAMGGNEVSAYGLCHLGDYEATVFSEYSHNRKYGEQFVRGEPYTALAEGFYTVKALMQLETIYTVELPICRAVYRVLYEGVAPKLGLASLFSRSVKTEFYE